MKRVLRLGSRGSPLALLQAEEARKSIFSAQPKLADQVAIEIVPIHTSGDWRPDQREQSFRELGGNKELFTKEIDDALLSGMIDMAVHSMKDVATLLTDGIDIMATLARVDTRDAFIGRTARRLEDLPPGAVVGTASLRRQAQILAFRPDLRIAPLRGNVETRLKKIADGQADATLLALAGLIRLGLRQRVSSVIPTAIMLPAAAQGAIGIAARRGDADMRAILQPANARETFVCVMAERAFLRKLDGSCQTPIGALAVLDAKGDLQLEGMAAKTDGSSVVRLKTSGSADEAEAVGEALGARMREALPTDFFVAC